MSRRGCLVVIVAAGILLATLLGWFAWQGSDATLPPLAKGLDGTFTTVERQLDRRVKALYPVGSSEPRLLADLRSQGFDVHIERGGTSMADIRRFIGCGDKVISIRWTARNGVITDIFGVYGAVCL